MDRAQSRYQHTAEKMDRALLELLEKKDFAYITVRELCRTAQVSRSTFYLHYETVGDLLNECERYVVRQCFDRYGGGNRDISRRLATVGLEELVFISPEYLRPYFEFVRENRLLFKVVFSRSGALRMERTFDSLFRDVFSPVLDRFRFPDENKRFTMSFYIAGLMAVVREWIRTDCETPIERVIQICMQCILPAGAAVEAYCLPGGGGAAP